MLAFAIPFSGYGQESEAGLQPYVPQSDFVVVNTGIAFSNLYPESGISTEYIHRFQYSVYYERYIKREMNPKTSVKIGLQYTQKGHDIGFVEKKIKVNNEIVDLERSSLHIELDYLTLPLSLKYVVINTPTNQRVYLELGGYISKLLNQQYSMIDFDSVETISKYPKIDYGVHLGAGIEFDFNDFYVDLPLIFVAEYNLQLGLNSLLKDVPDNYNITHSINVGIKFSPSIF